jgi:hypothetical protein
MASPESIHRYLSVAATLLDHAATEIRDTKLEPVRENIERIGKALAEAFEIQRQVYLIRPDLKPEYLEKPSELSVANRSLTRYMYRASDCELAGDIKGAIAAFQEFLTLESSPLHRDIAATEIERLQRATDA